jgi:hypothetical protein
MVGVDNFARNNVFPLMVPVKALLAPQPLKKGDHPIHLPRPHPLSEATHAEHVP